MSEIKKKEDRTPWVITRKVLIPLDTNPDPDKNRDFYQVADVWALRGETLDRLAFYAGIKVLPQVSRFVDFKPREAATFVAVGYRINPMGEPIISQASKRISIPERAASLKEQVAAGKTTKAKADFIISNLKENLAAICESAAYHRLYRKLLGIRVTYNEPVPEVELTTCAAVRLLPAHRETIAIAERTFAALPVEEPKTEEEYVTEELEDLPVGEIEPEVLEESPFEPEITEAEQEQAVEEEEIERRARAEKPSDVPNVIPCSKCEQPMYLRLGKYGWYYACSGYPKCKNTLSIKKYKEQIATAEPEQKEQGEGTAEQKPLLE